MLKGQVYFLTSFKKQVKKVPFTVGVTAFGKSLVTADKYGVITDDLNVLPTDFYIVIL